MSSFVPRALMGVFALIATAATTVAPGSTGLRAPEVRVDPPDVWGLDAGVSIDTGVVGTLRWAMEGAGR